MNRTIILSKQWFKQLFCRHDWNKAHQGHAYDHFTSRWRWRKCPKCKLNNTGGHASDGRFYWVKYDGELTINQQGASDKEVPCIEPINNDLEYMCPSKGNEDE